MLESDGVANPAPQLAVLLPSNPPGQRFHCYSSGLAANYFIENIILNQNLGDLAALPYPGLPNYDDRLVVLNQLNDSVLLIFYMELTRPNFLI